MKKLIRLLALTLCVMMACCGMAAAEEYVYKLPLVDEPTTLTVYMQMASGSQQLMETLNDSPTIKKLEELTGVHVEWTCPPIGDDGTFFNMLIASGDYPDVFVAADEISRYPGKVDGAIADGIIINHNELIEKYAPNYLAMFNAQSATDQLAMKTDSGVYKMADNGSNVVRGKQHTGMIIRKDWLDALGLEVPTTFEEFTNVLRAFKENYDVVVPFAFAGFSDYFITNGNVLSAGYGVTWDTFILDDEGKITHSYLQPGYGEFLEMLAGWMKEGLIDVDNINRTHDDCRKLFFAGQTGVIEIGNWETQEVQQLGKLEDEKFEIVPVSSLRKAEGEEIMGYSNVLGRPGGFRYFISTSCKNPELAMKWIDCLYDPEINLLNTFGVGDLGDGTTTYVIKENGEYDYSDDLRNNPDFPFATYRLLHYIQNLTTQILDSMELAQYNAQINLDCWDVWTKNVDDSRIVPGAIELTADEDVLVNEIMTEVKTYMSELALKVICGEADVAAWTEAVAGLEGMGINEAIAAQQAALDRFNAR